MDGCLGSQIGRIRRRLAENDLAVKRILDEPGPAYRTSAINERHVRLVVCEKWLAALLREEHSGTEHVVLRDLTDKSHRCIVGHQRDDAGTFGSPCNSG